MKKKIKLAIQKMYVFYIIFPLSFMVEILEGTDKLIDVVVEEFTNYVYGEEK